MLKHVLLAFVCLHKSSCLLSINLRLHLSASLCLSISVCLLVYKSIGLYLIVFLSSSSSSSSASSSASSSSSSYFFFKHDISYSSLSGHPASSFPRLKVIDLNMSGMVKNCRTPIGFGTVGKVGHCQTPARLFMGGYTAPRFVPRVSRLWTAHTCGDPSRSPAWPGQGRGRQI